MSSACAGLGGDYEPGPDKSVDNSEHYIHLTEEL
jgi:hypothetical protein